jgi:hypothetical protein
MNGSETSAFMLGVAVRVRRLLACTKPQAIIEKIGVVPKPTDIEKASTLFF